LLRNTAAGKTAAVFSLDAGDARLRRNIELKARCLDLPAARAAAEQLGARVSGMLEQLDTYFHCRHGRMKLRETAGAPTAELIWYDRSNEAKVRPSDYRLVSVPNPTELKAALNDALGVRGEVRKRRQLLMWHNVRIHLDDVEGLGSFVEFEAVIAGDDDEATAHERLGQLCEVLKISPGDFLRESYSDLEGL
jgi:adenylate cyclase class 2